MSPFPPPFSPSSLLSHLPPLCLSESSFCPVMSITKLACLCQCSSVLEREIDFLFLPPFLPSFPPPLLPPSFPSFLPFIQSSPDPPHLCLLSVSLPLSAQCSNSERAIIFNQAHFSFTRITFVSTVHVGNGTKWKISKEWAIRRSSNLISTLQIICHFFLLNQTMHIPFIFTHYLVLVHGIPAEHQPLITENKKFIIDCYDLLTALEAWAHIHRAWYSESKSWSAELGSV